MTALLLPFARRNSDGELVAPDEVARGLACDCSCPGCRQPVQARKGTEKVWHFAHDKASDCGSGYEISVHELAKQLIRQQMRLLIPALDVQAEAWDAFGRRLTEQVRVFESRAVPLDGCELSRPRELDGDMVTPDVTGRVEDREILIEITVFHRLMPEKRDRLLQMGVACMQIDLSQFKTIQATRELLTAALLEDSTNRHWIYHPRAASVAEELKAKLEPRIQSSLERKRIHDIRQSEIAAQLERRLTEAPTGTEIRLHAPRDLGRLQWRACFPSPNQVASAKQALRLRTGCEEALIESTVNSIQTRGQLARTTPTLLADQWALRLGVQAQEIIDFFDEGGYLSPY